MRVLILEDDLATRFLYRTCIEDAGHEVVECENVDQAVYATRTQQFDLLVVDLFLGRTNSLGFIQLAGYTVPHAEVILITGSDKFSRGEVLSEYPGVTWILRKPISINDLDAFVGFAEKRCRQRGIELLDPNLKAAI